MADPGAGRERCPTLVLWDERFEAYDFGPTHPFSEVGRALAVRLLEESGWVSDPPGPGIVRRAAVDRASDAELLSFHTAEYLRRIRAAGSSSVGVVLDRGDTPAFPDCFEAAARIVGGTLAGVRHVRSTPAAHALNPAGGLHHAAPSRASGFCIFNDLAVALRSSLAPIGDLRRAAYVDIDVHHGDGVMYGFFDDGRLLDIDLHQDGRTIFPGTGALEEVGVGDGAGLKVNLPLPPGSGDATFLPLFRAVVPTMLRRYRPELIVLQCGVDAHVGDRLGGLQYTPAAYAEAIELLHRLSHELCGGRLLVTGGGGYASTNVARALARVAWTLGIGEAGKSPPDPLPARWREEFERRTGEPAPRRWGEHPPVRPTGDERATVERLLSALSRSLGVRWEAPD